MKEERKGVYCRGTAEDTEDVLDFANMVFSMGCSAIDFAKVYPKVYSAERSHIVEHHMIKEGNKIRALIDLYPLTLRQVDCEITAAYIGTVSVHPRSRSKGYMSELMKQAEESARKMGCSLIMIDGNRHRYQHYGFEKAGMKYCFHIGWRNIRHYCSSLHYDTAQAWYQFVLLEPQMENFNTYLDAMYALYMQRFVTARSRYDFYLCLRSEQAEVYVVLKEKEFAGYISILEDENIVVELELRKNSQLPKVIYDLMEEFDVSELKLAAGMDEVEKIEYLDKMSDYYNIGMSHQMKILNHQKALEFLLRWKQKYDTLAAGEYVIGIVKNSTPNIVGSTAETDAKFEQENYLIKVAEGVVSVQITDELADLVLEDMEFVRTLTTSYWFHSHDRAESTLKKAPNGWFPLPFFLPDADAF